MKHQAILSALLLACAACGDSGDSNTDSGTDLDAGIHSDAGFDGGFDGPFEGFGAVTEGAGGCPGHEIVQVTTLADSGAGSLREALSAGCRLVRFTVGGDILLESAIVLDHSFVTIDGATAPSPGITLTKSSVPQSLLVLEGASDVITVSWSLFYRTAKAMLIKYGPHRNLSIHHNLFTRNTERNPQVRQQVELIDFVNNVVHLWGQEPGVWGYGMRLYDHDSDSSTDYGGDGLVDANCVGNVFVPNGGLPENAVQLLDGGGDGLRGDVYFHDNIVPASNADTRFPNAEEQSLIDEAAQALQ